MPVTKYDLSIIVNNYFIATLTSPKHPVTPDVCDRFAYNCYSLIVSIPSDDTAYQRLLNYVVEMADYYGVDLNKADQYLKTIPGIKDMFLQYIKDTYRIETNTEIIRRVTNDAFAFVGEAIASTVWAFIKPLLPLALLGLGLMYAIGKVSPSKK